MRTVYVAEYPAIQHAHPDGAVVTVRLKRSGGGMQALCDACGTLFVYRKPARSTVEHHRSPLLPPVKGNWDSGEGDH